MPAPDPRSAIDRAAASSGTARPDSASAMCTPRPTAGAWTVVGASGAASAARSASTTAAAGCGAAGATPASAGRCDDQVAVRLLALGPGLDPAALLQVLVHHLALYGAHRVQRHGLARLLGAFRRLV